MENKKQFFIVKGISLFFVLKNRELFSKIVIKQCLIFLFFFVVKKILGTKLKHPPS